MTSKHENTGLVKEGAEMVSSNGGNERIQQIAIQVIF
jgi:hypothetical protein